MEPNQYLNPKPEPQKSFIRQPIQVPVLEKASFILESNLAATHFKRKEATELIRQIPVLGMDTIWSHLRSLVI
jgi:hypothetical protein